MQKHVKFLIIIPQSWSASLSSNRLWVNTETGLQRSNFRPDRIPKFFPFPRIFSFLISENNTQQIKLKLSAESTADKATHLAALPITGGFFPTHTGICQLLSQLDTYWEIQTSPEIMLKLLWKTGVHQSEAQSLLLRGKKGILRKGARNRAPGLYTLLHSLRCHLSCEVGWEKAMSFSTGGGNDWAL